MAELAGIVRTMGRTLSYSASSADVLADVLIIGGGPAGLAAALALRQRGITVTVADAMKPPIDKACGEGLLPDSLRELALLGVELEAGEGARFNGIQFLNYLARSGGAPEDAVTAHFPADPNTGESAGLGIRRQALHRRMVRAAESAGVRLMWETQAQLLPDGQVLVAGRAMRFGCLVGADGQSSQVRRWAGLERGVVWSRRYGFRRHVKVAPWSALVEVHWSRSGQAYVTPVGPDEVCVAAVSRDPQCRMAEILGEMPWLREKLGRGLANADRERGALTTTRRLKCVATGRVALVGDASGSVDAITGEGLALAFRQALLLAECLGMGSSELGLARYDRLHPDLLRRPQTMARAMLLMDRSAWVRRAAMRVMARRPEIFAGLVGVHMGAETLPGLVTAQGRAMVRRLGAAASDPAPIRWM